MDGRLSHVADRSRAEAVRLIGMKMQMDWLS